MPHIDENAFDRWFFGRSIYECLCRYGEAGFEEAFGQMTGKGVTSLGPAVANLRYFPRSTLVAASNTDIVLGFNAVTDAKQSWNGGRYLPYGELEKHREAMARFGEGSMPSSLGKAPLTTLRNPGGRICRRKISHKDRRAWVIYDPLRTDAESLAKAVSTKAGYKATVLYKGHE